MRVQQIKGNNKPFEGATVLAVGDFFQLPLAGKAEALCIYKDSTVDVWLPYDNVIRNNEREIECCFCRNARLGVKWKTEQLQDCDRALLATHIFPAGMIAPLMCYVYVTNKDITITTMTPCLPLVSA